MNATTLKKAIAGCCNDVIFDYNGKKSVITSVVEDYVPTFQAWHGSEVKEYKSVDEVMKDKFFSGKSIMDLINTVKISLA